MKYDEFIAAVEQRAHIPRERAEAVTRATLETLSERITRGEAKDLASQLPKQLQDPVLADPSPEAEAFGLEEFERRVAVRAGLPRDEVEDGIRAVLTTVREAVTGGEFEDIVQQLPDEFWRVIEPTSWRGEPVQHAG